MKKSVFLKLWGFLGIVVLMVAFLLLSYFVQSNIGFFEKFIIGNVWGLVVYFFLNVLGVVVAPIAVIPLIVVVTKMWGPVVAAVFTLIGWIVGAAIAFWIARRFGVPIVRRFISMKELYRFEERFSLLNSFWGIVFLRMIVPVEILSYGLGLFSRVGFWKYIAASFVGLFPVAFLLGYFGIIRFVYQVLFAICILIVILIVMILKEVFDRNYFLN